MDDQATHIDGTICPEGTARLNPDKPVCCEAFGYRTKACYFDIRYEYWPANKGWFVIITPDAGGGGVAINFCPHCGEKLTAENLDGRWIELD